VRSIVVGVVTAGGELHIGGPVRDPTPEFEAWWDAERAWYEAQQEDRGVDGQQAQVRELVPESEPSEVLTVTDAAVLLRVNEKTLRTAIAAGQLPGVRRLGRVIRLSRTALLDWLRGKQAT
jgi:excisionase family DNA binding protein